MSRKEIAPADKFGPIAIRTAYEDHPRVTADVSGKSMTRQSDAEACDINRIMKRYEATGILPEATRQGLFIDVSNFPDYRGALEQVQYADRIFMQLPADTRAKFNNDAAEFLDFCSDPLNRDAMKEMGLLEPDPVVDPLADPPPAAPAVE